MDDGPQLAGKIVRRCYMAAIAVSTVVSVSSTALGDDKHDARQDRRRTTPLTAVDEAPVLVPIGSTALKDQPGSVIQRVSGEERIPVETTKAVLQAKQDDVALQLRVALLQEQSERSPDDASRSEPRAEASNVDLLKQVEVIIAQQKNATSTLQDLQSKQADLTTELSKLSGDRLDEEPPYSILLLDQLRDSLASSKAKRESSEASLLTAREAVERASAAVEARKKALRQQTEQSAAGAEAKLNAAELEVRLAEEMLVLRHQELAIEESNEVVRAIQLKIDEQKIAIVSGQVQFTREMLDQQTVELDARESELKRKNELLKSEYQYAERRWLAARQEVDSTPNPTPDLLERVDALKVAQQTIQLEDTTLNQQLQRLPAIRTAWERRYLVVSGQAKREDRRLWLSETVRQLDLLARERRSRELKLDETRVTLATAAAKLDAASTANPEVKRWLQSKHDSLTKQIEIYNSSILSIDTAIRVLGRLRLEIEGEQARTFSEWMADTWAAAKRLWNSEVTTIENTSLTVGKVASSVLLMLFGYFAARILSRLLGSRMPRLGVDEAGAYAIESLSFYVFLIAFGLAALRYANVPLTVFTFLGGAIAIGVGFGSQNILNNFISGLILMAERPIKVGDLIHIDEAYGNVTQIGARSTQIRTGENQDIIVPNSKFLENNVINLTRRDDRLRTSISIGVAYGSPLERVMELLEQAAVEHPGVHVRPKPFVWFNDFGDNALAFQVHFWINARSVSQMRTVETEIRLSIDRLFRANDIVIAFPQRDVHLQMNRPIEFRMVGDDASGGSEFRATG